MKALKKMMMMAMCLVLLVGMGSVPTQALTGQTYIGAIELFPYERVPEGWLACNGQTLPIASYQNLFAKIGATFGGNGSTTFALPNLTAKAPVANTMYYIAYDGEFTVGTDCSIGEVSLFPDSAMRDAIGWVKCDGTTLNKNSYGPLFALIGNQYGGTDPNFKVPNLTLAKPHPQISYYIPTMGLMPSPDGVGSESLLGSIDLFAYTSIPRDYYLCNGATKPVVQNQALNSLITGRFGPAGTNLTLPNLTGKEPSTKMRYGIANMGVYPVF